MGAPTSALWTHFTTIEGSFEPRTKRWRKQCRHCGHQQDSRLAAAQAHILQQCPSLSTAERNQAAALVAASRFRRGRGDLAPPRQRHRPQHLDHAYHHPSQQPQAHHLHSQHQPLQDLQQQQQHEHHDMQHHQEGQGQGLGLDSPYDSEGPGKSRKRAALDTPGGGAASPSATALLAMHDVAAGAPPGAGATDAAMLESLSVGDHGGGASAYYRPLTQDPHNSSKREAPLQSGRAALLFVDIQNYNCSPSGALGSQLQGDTAYYWQRIHEATPLWAQLADAARNCGVEVIYTVIQSLTRDGRDRGRDYKLSGFHVPPGSWDAQVLDGVRPGPDDIVLPKTSSSLFNSTTLEFVLRNMDIQQLAVCGALTDQCVDHTIRDGADRGLDVTQITDACVTHNPERHASSIQLVSGYCRQITAAEALSELQNQAVNVEGP